MSVRVDRLPEPMKDPGVHAIDLGIVDYPEAFNLQKRIVSGKVDGDVNRDFILILEHPAVFTLGKRGGRENLRVSSDFLESRQIRVIQTQRGGNITYHGLGQVILYPIIKLEKAGFGVSDFVHCLEEVMIRTCSDVGVKAQRNDRNHGIWVDNQKIGSIGLSIKRKVSFHGLALNVNLDLEPFSWIHPCGMQGVAMTSIAREFQKSGRIVEKEIMGHIKKRLLLNFSLVTGLGVEKSEYLPIWPESCPCKN